ncbi:MAG: hypothetical protein U9O94_00735 [Nanoarchaeota archaeon]|nr:hypothetical protein [Nanoarchaeota archaeon]
MAVIILTSIKLPEKTNEKATKKLVAKYGTDRDKFIYKENKEKETFASYITRARSVEILYLGLAVGEKIKSSINSIKTAGNSK